jgi:hypothetical protein
MERDFNIHNWQAKFLKEESSNTKTAIEWLESKFYEFETIYDSLPTGLYEYVEQAKEMEKQQIIDAFDSGWNRGNDTKDTAYSSAEDYGKGYYNNKYK